MSHYLSRKDLNIHAYVDPRDGQTYETIELWGKTWLAENLNFKTEKGSWFFDNSSSHGAKYGRLYNWQVIDEACPPGWRIPSDEEWKDLMMHFGGFHDLFIEEGDSTQAYEALIQGGSSGFNVLLGGYRNSNGQFSHLNSLTGYWSSTESDGEDAIFYRFNGVDKRVYRWEDLKAGACYCRCVKQEF